MLISELFPLLSDVANAMFGLQISNCGQLTGRLLYWLTAPDHGRM